MVLRWKANTAFTDWKIKYYLKECLDISGGTWLSRDLAQVPVALEFGKKKAGFYSEFVAILRDWLMASGQKETDTKM